MQEYLLREGFLFYLIFYKPQNLNKNTTYTSKPDVAEKEEAISKAN
jgi:hypothetical protein